MLRGVLLLLATALVLCFLIRRAEWQTIGRLLRTIPLSVWTLAVALTLTFPILMAWRWQLVLAALGVKIPVKQCLLIVVGVWPLSAISPSKSGDLLRAVSLRDRVPPVVTAGSVLAERVLDVFVLALFAAGGGLYFHNNLIVLAGAGVLTLVAAAFAVAHSNWRFPIDKVQASLDQLLQSMRALLDQPRYLAAALCITGANWMASIIQTQLLFSALEVALPLSFTMAALPVAIFVGLIPITFAGMGTRDSAMVFLFSQFADLSEILTVSLLYTFFGYWLLAFLGIPFVKKAMRL